MRRRTGFPQLLALLGLVALLPGCFTVAALIAISTRHTNLELSIERAWTAPDGGIGIAIDGDAGDSKHHKLLVSITRSELEAAFQLSLDPAAKASILRLPSAAVQLDPSSGVPPADPLQAGMTIARLPAGSAPLTDLDALAARATSSLCILECTREISASGSAGFDYGIAIARKSAWQTQPQIARFEVRLEGPIGDGGVAPLWILLLGVGLDVLVFSTGSGGGFASL